MYVDWIIDSSEFMQIKMADHQSHFSTISIVTIPTVQFGTLNRTKCSITLCKIHRRYLYSNQFNRLLFLIIYFPATILQPSNSILLPQSMGAQVEYDLQAKSPTLSNVGQTWSNAGPLNIDLDNLLSTKSNKSGPSLSMNQLALQSPVKQSQNQSQLPLMSPPPLHINNNAAKNNFNNLNNNFSGNLTQQPNRFSGNVQQPSQQQLFGNLMMTSNPNANLNNHFDAFQ